MWGVALKCGTAMIRRVVCCVPPEVMAEQRPPQSHVPLRCVFAKLCNARPFVDDIWMGFGAGGEVRKRWAPHLTVDSLRLVSVVSAQCGFAGKS